MSLFPPRSQIDLGGMRLFPKSSLNVTVAHGNPFSTFELPPAVDSEIVFTESAPAAGFQVQQTGSGKLIRVKHRFMSGGAIGDASVLLQSAMVDKNGNNLVQSMGFPITPSAQPGLAFDIEHVFDVSAFAGVLSDASICIVLQRAGSGDTLPDPIHLLQSWMEIVNP